MEFLLLSTIISFHTQGKRYDSVKVACHLLSYTRKGKMLNKCTIQASLRIPLAVYGHTTTAMHDDDYTPPQPHPRCGGDLLGTRTI